MVTFKINSAKTFLPAAMRRGTAGERLERSIQMNDRFGQDLKENFIDGEMSRTKFVRLLQKNSDKHIPIQHYDRWDTKGNIVHRANGNAVLAGYFVEFPKNINSDKVKLKNLKSLLQTTQKFFDTILNPKFSQREFSMFNKGQNLQRISEFFTESVNVKGALDKKLLTKFLKPLSTKEKIDTLQLLRYKLIKEQNADRYKKHFMQMVNQTPRTDTYYSEAAINSNAYMYPEKMQIIEQELLKVLKKARSKK